VRVTVMRLGQWLDGGWVGAGCGIWCGVVWCGACWWRSHCGRMGRNGTRRSHGGDITSISIYTYTYMHTNKYTCMREIAAALPRAPASRTTIAVCSTSPRLLPRKHSNSARSNSQSGLDNTNSPTPHATHLSLMRNCGVQRRASRAGDTMPYPVVCAHV
jgi:hypothetical protein